MTTTAHCPACDGPTERCGGPDGHVALDREVAAALMAAYWHPEDRLFLYFAGIAPLTLA